MKRVNFELNDVDGKRHRYEVELFSCDEQARYQLMLGGSLIEGIGQLAAQLAPLVKSGAIDFDAGSFNLGDILGEVDWQGVPKIILPMIAEIERRGGSKVVADIFARTWRLTEVPEHRNLPVADGQPVDKDIRSHLADSGQRDLAFSDGNMAEYWKAAAMVLIVNFTRHGRNGSLGLNELVSMLTFGIVDPSAPANETQEPNTDRPSVAVSRRS